MPVLSLRITLAALSAATVALVAGVTLSLALTSSLDALRVIGQRHVGALLATATLQTDAFFREPTEFVTQMINVSESRNWTFPSDDPATLDQFFELARTEWYGGSQANGINLYFADNTHIFIGPDVDLEAQGRYESRITHATSYAADYPNQLVWVERLAYSLTTHAMLENITAPNAIAVKYTTERLWQTFDIATFNSYAPVLFPMVSIYANTGRIVTMMPVAAPLYRAGTTQRGQRHLFGYVVTMAMADDISRFLNNTKSTPGTAAFAYDRALTLVGSSEATPILQGFPRTHPVGSGCTATADYATAATAIFEPRVMCRMHTGAYPNAALNALTAQSGGSGIMRPDVGDAPVERIGDLGGEPYYVAAARVRIAFRGLEVYLLLLMPEADVIGDVITSRNVAIGVTCGLVVLAAAVNAAVVWALLAPLGGIAERMVRAANLEDDGEDATVSAMAEVAELQEAYYAMNAELNRIRSYVPQSVLVARKVARGEDDAEDEHIEEDMVETTADTSIINPDDAAQPPRRSSVHASPSQSVRSKRTLASTASASGGGKNAAALIVATAAATSAAPVSSRNVSVVAANVRGLHTLLRDAGGPRVVADTIASATEGVEAAVTKRQGVLTFHGDRFLATFNTARPCAGHASKAALAAVMCTSAKTFVGSGSLRITAGVATGPCLVGSVGSATMKTLSTVGPAVSNAALLEQLTREHDGVSVLATHRTCVDAATAVRVRYVDLANIPAGKAGDKRVTAIAAISAMHGDSGIGDGADGGAPQDAEWMYVLEGAGSGADAAFNEAFEALQRDDPARALEALANALDSASEADSGPAASPPSRLAAIAERLRAQMSAGSAPSVRDALERSSVQCQKSATAAVE